jgi:hypothetical protein
MIESLCLKVGRRILQPPAMPEEAGKSQEEKG